MNLVFLIFIATCNVKHGCKKYKISSCSIELKLIYASLNVAKLAASWTWQSLLFRSADIQCSWWVHSTFFRVITTVVLWSDNCSLIDLDRGELLVLITLTYMEHSVLNPSKNLWSAADIVYLVINEMDSQVEKIWSFCIVQNKCGVGHGPYEVIIVGIRCNF